MKSPSLLSALFITSLASLSQAQTPAVVAPKPVAEVPKLTEAQVSNVLTQLKELENQILQMRGNNLSTVLTKLRAGLASDQAATSLYLECDRLVNSERKEADKAEARRRQEAMERNIDRKGGGGGGGAKADDEGEFALAIRFGLQYLIMTLEAHEAKDEDFKKMVPKLQSYIQELVAAAPKLKGRSANYLNTALTGRNPIIEAFQLERFLEREGWSTRPMDFGSMYSQTILPLAEEENKESLPALWDARINAEGAFKKENMPEPEFILWTQNQVPALRWARARYLYEKGPSPINAMADMLKLIKENPNHPDAPGWVKELRTMVNEASPTPVSESAEKPAGE